jgi:hypothetical protein
MPHSSDAPHLTPEQRRREIAAILAKGILRLHTAGPRASESAVSDRPDDAPEPLEKGLELSAPSRPYVTRG